jgi:hypothetical protein
MNGEDNIFSNNDSALSEFLDPSLASLLGTEDTSLGIVADDGSYKDILAGEESLSLIEESIARAERERAEVQTDNQNEIEFFEYRPLPLHSSSSSDNSEANIDALTGAEAQQQVNAPHSVPTVEINAAGVMSVPDGDGQTVTTTLSSISRKADFNNETGLFLVDDETGRIGNLTPGDEGYAAAALSSERRKLALDSNSEEVTAAIPKGAFIAAYLIQNSTTAEFLATNPDNRLDGQPLAFFSGIALNPDNSTHLQSSSNINNYIQLAWEDLTGGGDSDFNDLVVGVGFDVPPVIPTVNRDNFAVYTESQLILNQSSDFDGDSLNLSDDALIHAGEGFFFNQEQVLPVERDGAGNPLVDENNRQTLIDNAITVGEDYFFASADKSQELYHNLIPPQIVNTQPLELPPYQQLVQQQLDSYLTDDGAVIDFNLKNNRLNNANQWRSRFPAPGTEDDPTIVRVTGGKLTIPSGVNLENYVIIVKNGDIKFNGTQQNLDNVVLIAETGKIEIDRLDANNATILAAEKIEIKNDTHFRGENLIANGNGNIELKNSTTAISQTDGLTVYAAGDLLLQGVSQARGKFFAADEIEVKGNSTIYGRVAAKGDITFLGSTEVIAIPEVTEELPIANIESHSVNETDTSVLVSVNLSAPSSVPVTLDYATSDAEAIAGRDYRSARGTLTFAPGETNKTIEVAIIGDSIDEANESFNIELSNPNRVTLGNAIGRVNILDNDSPPQISIDNLEVVEGADSTTANRFTVTLSSPSSLPVTVDYSTIDGGAVEGSDYQSVRGKLTFAPGETSKTIELPVLDDSIDEERETLTLQLTNPVNATVASQTGGTATIVDNDSEPELTVGDFTLTEGDGGTTNASFTVTLSAPSSKEISIDYATADGSATAGTDYTAVSGTLNFAPGETSKTIEVTVLSDVIEELDEAFSVQISNPHNATIARTTGTATIIDDDEPPSATIDDITAAESNEGTTEAVFTVTLSAPSNKEISIDYATANGTATAGTDYTAVSGKLTFAPGETSKTISVVVLGDNLDEVDEAFTLNFSNAANVVLSQTRVTGTIVDDNAAPVIAISDTSIIEGDDSAKTALVTVSLSAASSQEISVDYTTSDGTAVAGTDYTAVSGRLNFAPGETTKTIEIEVTGDILDEIDEAFVVNLSHASNATIDESAGTVAIIDNDLPPKLSIDNLEVVEGDSGTSEAVFTVTLDNPSNREISVDYATSDNTAIAGTDYTAVSGRLNFAPGETSKTITVRVTGDIIDEIDEAFVIDLSNASNATINDNRATATISDNDLPPTITLNDISLDETDAGTTNAAFTVRLDNPSSKEISIDYATSDNTAIAGLDYLASNGTITFEPGAREKTIEIGIIGDVIDEPDEAFNLNLSNPTNATIAEAEDTATGTIVDDDLPPIALSLSLANDTGNNSDKITTDPTINGSIEYVRGEINLSASLNNNSDLIDISDLLQPDGSFVLNKQQLQTINGGSFDEGTYALKLVATDRVTGDVTESELTFTFDATLTPEFLNSLTTAINYIDLDYGEAVSEQANNPNNYNLTLENSDTPPVAVAIDSIQQLNDSRYRLHLASNFKVGNYNLNIASEVKDIAGNSADSTALDWTIDTESAIEISPTHGEEMVNLTRETIVRFKQKIDPTTVNEDSFYLIANGERLPGNIKVSSTNEFATFFYDEPLPPSTEVRVVVEGDKILTDDGVAIDADTDGNAGGMVTADFTTLPLTRIEGTDVFGYVYDSYNTNPDGSNIPIVGATIRLDALPDVFAVTDENGYFRLEDVPAPGFAVHIDGSTAINPPENTSYATVGKLFHSQPGQETQLTMDGEPFDIYLPPMAMDDIQQLSPTEATDVGFGAAGKDQLEGLFPEIDSELWDLVKVTFPQGSAMDEEGNAATQATIIPVAPDRLPAPLPPHIEPIWDLGKRGIIREKCLIQAV